MHFKNIFLTIVILSATACSHSMDPYNTEEDLARYNELRQQQESKAELCKLTVNLDKSVHDLGINDDDTIAFIKEFAALKLKFDYLRALTSNEAFELRFEAGKKLPDETTWQEIKKLEVNKKEMTLFVVPKLVPLKKYTEAIYSSNPKKNTIFSINYERTCFQLKLNEDQTFADLKDACKLKLQSEYDTFVKSDQKIWLSFPRGIPTPKDTDILGNLDIQLHSNLQLAIIDKDIQNKQAQTQ